VFYILKRRKPVRYNDLFTYALAKNNYRNRVRVSYIGDLQVSTVFLNIDHDYCNKGRPILFETMIFKLSAKGSEPLDYQLRCSTHREALHMHRVSVKFAKGYVQGSSMRQNEGVQ